MRKPGGFTFLLDGDGRLTEGESFTCRHCQRITWVKPHENPEDIGGLCKVCMGLICAPCLDKPCLPFEEEFQRMQRRSDALRSYGLS